MRVCLLGGGGGFAYCGSLCPGMGVCLLLPTGGLLTRGSLSVGPLSKQRLGQGNVFTPVCLFTGGGGSARVSASRGLPKQVCLGRSFASGQPAFREVCIQGEESPSKGSLPGEGVYLGGSASRASQFGGRGACIQEG